MPSTSARFLLAAVLLAAALLPRARAQLATEPLLRVEAGMHTAPITRVSVSADGSRAATVAQDGTLRIWSVPDGALVKVLRMPLGLAPDQRLSAVALSPDARRVAAAGRAPDGRSEALYVFDVQRGQILARRDLGVERLIRIRYSPDGRYFVGVGPAGMQVFAGDGSAELARDTSYEAAATGVDFGPGGDFVVSAYDGRVRHYNAELDLVRTAATENGREAYSIAWSPDGTRIAVGFQDAHDVDVLSATDLSYMHRPFVRPDAEPYEYDNVGWTADSTGLYAGGAREFGGDIGIFKFTNDFMGPLTFNRRLAGVDNTVLDIAVLPQGGLVYVTAEPSIGIVNADDELTAQMSIGIGDYRDAFLGFPVSGDGRTVGYSYEAGARAPAVFSLEDRAIRLGEALEEGPRSGSLAELLGAAMRTPDWDAITDEELHFTGNTSDRLRLDIDAAGETAVLNGRPLPLEADERVRAASLALDDSGFALGTSRFLRYYDADGSERWRVRPASEVWQVAVASERDAVVAHVADGTVRWYRTADGEELLAFFPHGDQRRWIAWTPSGYYAAPGGADDLAGWHVNNGEDAAPDFYSIARFRDTYYRPDIVTRVLDTLDEAEAIQAAVAAGGAPPAVQAVEERLPPVAAILSPGDGERATETTFELSYDVRNEDADSETNVQVLIDGRPMGAARGLRRVEDEPAARSVTVTIPPRDVTVSLVASNVNGAGEPATIRLRWAGAPVQPAAQADANAAAGRAPRLNMLAVGVSDYALEQLKLNFPAKDAADVSSTFEGQRERFYDDVSLRVLTDAQASKDAILDGLQWLYESTTPADTAVLFLAGHGVNSETGAYYFLPTDADPSNLRRTGLSYADVKDAITSVPGKALLFVDTCYSGGVLGGQPGVPDIDQISNDLSSAENGVVVFAASTGRQQSLENPVWGNGAFTKAVVEGLTGSADYTRDRQISVSELELYVSERVKELTESRQTPTTAKPRTVPDFRIARLE